MISSRNVVNRKEIPKNEKPDKVINTVDEILNFDKQQEGSELKKLTPEQMLQRLPIALAQVKAGTVHLKIY